MKGDERPMRTVGEAIERLAADLGLEEHRPAISVHDGWNEAAGEEVAAHALPRQLVDGVLTVEVDDPAWATHVRYLGPAIVASLNEAAGAPVVAEIRVVVARPRTGPRDG